MSILLQILLLISPAPLEVVLDKWLWSRGEDDKLVSTTLRGLFFLSVSLWFDFFDINTWWQTMIILPVAHEALFSFSLNLARWKTLSWVFSVTTGREYKPISEWRYRWERLRFVLFYHPDKGWDRIYHRYIPWYIEPFLKFGLLYIAIIIYI